MAQGKRTDPNKLRADQEAILRDTERFVPRDAEDPAATQARKDRIGPPARRVVTPKPKSPPVRRGGIVTGRRPPSNTA
jgi:hypothetical protein